MANEHASLAGEAKPADSKPAEITPAKPPETARPTAEGSDAKSAAGKPAAPAKADAVALIKADHRAVERLFEQADAADGDAREDLIAAICKALTVHTMLEEEILYPACREVAQSEDPLDEAQVEHDAAKLLIDDLQHGRPDDPFRAAKLKVLAEEIRHHIGEEEKPRTGILARAQQQGVNTPELAEHLTERKSELEQARRLPRGRPVSIHIPGANAPQSKESAMSNSQTRERDSRGRFTDDDRDERGGRGYTGRARDEEGRFVSDRDDDRGHRGGGSQGGGGRDDDRRGWYGDSRGHAEAARRGWQDREEGRGRGTDTGRSRGYEDDDRGRRSFSSRYEDDDRDSRGRGRGGWFGDPEGHSEASRRGWENADHGNSGWYGDSRGHAEASRRGWDNSDHRGSGWYGDSEGHSEASRRGWEERGGSRGSGRYEDDDRGGRMGRGRDEDDRGHGGWSGDPRGHAEAARRGWENRR